MSQHVSTGSANISGPDDGNFTHNAFLFGYDRNFTIFQGEGDNNLGDQMYFTMILANPLQYLTKSP